MSSTAAGSSGGGSNQPNRIDDTKNNSTNNSDNNNSGGEQNLDNSNQNNPSQSNGTPCNLPGVIYHETESGMLVVNVTWKNKTFIGTLLDSTKYKWAPPRLTDGDSETDNRKSKKKYTNTRSMIPGTTQSSQKRTTRRSKQAAMSSATLDEGTKNTLGSSKKQKNKTKKEKEAEKRAEREQKQKEAKEEEEKAKREKESALEEQEKNEARLENKKGGEKVKYLEEGMKDVESDENESLAKKVVRSGKKTSQRANTPTKNNDEDYNPKGTTKRYKAKDYKEEGADESGNGGKKRKGAKNDSKQESKKPKRGPTPTAEKPNGTGEKTNKDGTPVVQGKSGSSLPVLHKFDEKTGVKSEKSEKIKDTKKDERKVDDKTTSSHKSDKSEKSHKSDKHKSDKHKSDKTEKSGSDKLSGEKHKSEKHLESVQKSSKNAEPSSKSSEKALASKEKSPVVPMPALHRAPVEDKMDTDDIEDKSGKKSMPPPQNQCLPPSPSNINDPSVNSPAKRVSPAYSDISDASNSPTPIQQETGQSLLQKPVQKPVSVGGQTHQKLGVQNPSKQPVSPSTAQIGQKNGVQAQSVQGQNVALKASSNISPKSGSNGFGPPPKLQSAPPKPVQNKPGMPGQKSLGPGNYQKPMPVKPNTMHQQKPQFPQQNAYKRPVNGDVFQKPQPGTVARPPISTPPTNSSNLVSNVANPNAVRAANQVLHHSQVQQSGVTSVVTQNNQVPRAPNQPNHPGNHQNNNNSPHQNQQNASNTNNINNNNNKNNILPSHQSNHQSNQQHQPNHNHQVQPNTHPNNNNVHQANNNHAQQQQQQQQQQQSPTHRAPGHFATPQMPLNRGNNHHNRGGTAGGPVSANRGYQNNQHNGYQNRTGQQIRPGMGPQGSVLATHNATNNFVRSYQPRK